MFDQAFIDVLKNYWYAAVGAFFGTGLVLLIDYFHRKSKKKEAVKALIKCIEHNNHLMVLAQNYFEGGGKPYFPLDPEGMNLWLSKAGDILKPEVSKLIDEHRYEIEHINNKMIMFGSSISILEKICGLPPQEVRKQEADSFRISHHLGLEIAKKDLLIHTLKS